MTTCCGGSSFKPIKYQVQGLCPEYSGSQCAWVFKERIEKRKKKVLRTHVHRTQKKEPSKIKGNVNFVKSSNAEKKNRSCIVRVYKIISEIILKKTLKGMSWALAVYFRSCIFKVNKYSRIHYLWQRNLHSISHAQWKFKLVYKVLCSAKYTFL